MRGEAARALPSATLHTWLGASRQIKFRPMIAARAENADLPASGMSDDDEMKLRMKAQFNQGLIMIVSALIGFGALKVQRGEPVSEWCARTAPRSCGTRGRPRARRAWGRGAKARRRPHPGIGAEQRVAS